MGIHSTLRSISGTGTILFGITTIALLLGWTYEAHTTSGSIFYGLALTTLDKFVYFFRTKTRAYETIRAPILDDLHGFRRTPGLSPDGDIVHAAFAPADELYWLNVSGDLDPISSRLAFFSVQRQESRWYSHTNYWHDPLFYRWVLGSIVREGTSIAAA